MKLVTQTSEVASRYGDANAIKMIKNAGFDGYDFTMGNHNFDLLFNNPDYIAYVQNLRAVADQIGIECLQAHAPSPLMRTADQVVPLIPVFLRAIEICSILGCKIMVVHPGSFLSAMENKTLLYDHLLPCAEQNGVIIATENMFKWKDQTETETLPSACGTAKDFVEHIDVINHPNFVACLDIGHSEMVNCEGAVKIIKALGGDRLKALHVQDNDLYHDNHLFPFAGKIDWSQVCKALKEIKYSGNFTFEADFFMKNYPDELIPDCLTFLQKTGRYLIKLIEE